MKLVERKTKGWSSTSKAKSFFFENYKPGFKLNVSETARSLGVTRVTIYNWIKEIKAND